jgi:hypothetical protein
MTTIVQNMIDLPLDDLRKLADLAEKLADFRQNEGKLSEQQVQVILQNLHTKELVRLATHKGGAFVEFTGRGFEYERFLVRADGRVPNNRYEAKKQNRE